MNLPKVSAISAILVGVFFLATTPEADATVHFALSKSTPEAETSVRAPAEIRLWFTQEPQEGTASIRLMQGEDSGVDVGEVRQAADDPKSFSVGIDGTLAAGDYTVSWRGMGADGHVVRDSFAFTVVAH